MRVDLEELGPDQFAPFVRRHGVRRLALFGSVLRKDFRHDSDVDLLVEFQPGHIPGLFGFAAMQLELSELLGRQVHLHTPPMLGPAFREEVLRSARLLYAA